jgi:acyl carrier protein
MPSNGASNVSVLDEIKRIIAKVLRLPAEQLREQMKLADLGAASMDAIEIVYEIEEKFDINFPTAPGENPLGLSSETAGTESFETQLNTIGDIAAIVQNLIDAKFSPDISR